MDRGACHKKTLRKSGFSLPTETGRQGTIFLGVYVSKRWLSGPKEIHVRLIKLAKALFIFSEVLHIFQKYYKELYSYISLNTQKKKKGRGDSCPFLSLIFNRLKDFLILTCICPYNRHQNAMLNSYYISKIWQAHCYENRVPEVS